MDVIYDLDLGIADTPEAILLDKTLQHKRLDDYDASVDLLTPVFRGGEYVFETESIHDIRKKAMAETDFFYRTHGEKTYNVGLEKKLYALKQTLIDKLK